MLRDLTVHDHFSFVYGTDGEAQRALVAYVVAGLDRRERVCVLTTVGAASATIGAELREAGVPVDGLVADGALVLGSAEQAYLTAGVFDADRPLTGYAEAARSAIADGFTGLRAYADSQFVLDRAETLAAWPGYELRADLVATRLPITAVCGYDVRRWPAADLELAETVHARRSRDHTTFRLRSDRSGALHLSGEVDFSASEQLHRLLVTAAPTRSRPVLDVSGLDFIDLNAARSLGKACEAVADRCGPTTIRGATPLLRRIWELTSWPECFPNMVIED